MSTLDAADFFDCWEWKSTKVKLTTTLLNSRKHIKKQTSKNNSSRNTWRGRKKKRWWEKKCEIASSSSRWVKSGIADLHRVIFFLLHEEFVVTLKKQKNHLMSHKYLFTVAVGGSCALSACASPLVCESSSCSKQLASLLRLPLKNNLSFSLALVIISWVLIYCLPYLYRLHIILEDSDPLFAVT